MHSLDSDGNYRAVKFDTSLDQRCKIPLGPTCAPCRKAAAMQEDNDRQRLRPRSPSIERRGRYVERQTLGVAEAVLRVRQTVLQQEVLIVDVLGVSNR